jgi:8-oxo-dGTP pyrophosphatase MutT (NUDIX family)
VSENRPAPDEELNIGGEPTVPRQAATVILLRRGGSHEDAGLEVLLVRRNPEARFMPDAWVFPGGAVDTAEADDNAAHRLCAIRELEEEAGVTLTDPGELLEFSRWITPAEVKTRFDTHFYVAPAPAHAKPEPDGEETVDAGWFAPADALDRWRAGEMVLVFPTIKHLEALLPFGTADEVLAAARERVVGPVQPRIVTEDGIPRVVLPGEPGYDD